MACFWTNKIGVSENCGDGGVDPPDPGLPGNYLYFLEGGLFPALEKASVRKLDMSKFFGDDPIEPVHVIGSGESLDNPSSLYRPMAMHARYNPTTTNVDVYVGEYGRYSVWVEGELARRSAVTTNGGFPVSALAWDSDNDRLIYATYNWSEAGNTPIFFSSNQVIYAPGQSLGDGSRWPSDQADLASFNGISGVAKASDGAMFVRDSGGAYGAYGRVSRWPTPYASAGLMFDDRARNSFETEPAKICLVEEPGQTPRIIYFRLSPDTSVWELVIRDQAGGSVTQLRTMNESFFNAITGMAYYDGYVYFALLSSQFNETNIVAYSLADEYGESVYVFPGRIVDLCVVTIPEPPPPPL